MEERQESAKVDEDATSTLSIVYRDSNVDLTLLRRLAAAGREEAVPFNRGLTSVIYRINIGDNDDERGDQVQRQAYCLKRVCVEDEVRPHSVQREIQCYRQIQEARGQDELPIMQLLAAFRNESDPFSIEMDLIMPLLTTTLEEVLEEPLIQFESRIEKPQLGLRPSLVVANAIHLQSTLDIFIRLTVQDLFSALTFLHGRQIAHRDIKPSNILIDIATLRIKLIDFGTCHLPSFAPGDDGKGGVTCEVGTGPYRAPESLFSPMQGYDASKVDIWQAGVTLVQFFLPLKKVAKVNLAKRKSIYEDDFDEYNQREDWEKALWADDDGHAWAQLALDSRPAIRDESKISRNAAAAADNDDDDDDDDDEEKGMSGWKRETLFDASKGDIGLASSQFDLRGLPDSLDEWPEAEYFQPSLQRMPFHPRKVASEGLRERLVTNIPAEMNTIIEIINQCIQLSASKRLDAKAAFTQLQ